MLWSHIIVFFTTEHSNIYLLIREFSKETRYSCKTLGFQIMSLRLELFLLFKQVLGFSMVSNSLNKTRNESCHKKFPSLNLQTLTVKKNPKPFLKEKWRAFTANVPCCSPSGSKRILLKLTSLWSQMELK